MTKKNNVFIEITNQDIFDKLNLLLENNTEQHNEIIIHQKATNGRVRLNKWIATTALSLVIILLGWLVIGA